MTMIKVGSGTLADLLMLFRYLEVLAMVGLYYGSGKLPVRFPLYIATVTLRPYLVLDMKEMNGACRRSRARYCSWRLPYC